MTHSSEGVVGLAVKVIEGVQQRISVRLTLTRESFPVLAAKALQKAGLLSGGKVRIRLPKPMVDDTSDKKQAFAEGWNACLSAVHRPNPCVGKKGKS